MSIKRHENTFLAAAFVSAGLYFLPASIAVAEEKPEKATSAAPGVDAETARTLAALTADIKRLQKQVEQQNSEIDLLAQAVRALQDAPEPPADTEQK